ncbi:MAG: hypothetical protein AAFQ98_08930 [Bacteroidota bacterium]
MENRANNLTEQVSSLKELIKEIWVADKSVLAPAISEALSEIKNSALSSHEQNILDEIFDEYNQTFQDLA